MLSNALTEWIKVNIILDLYVSVHNAFWLFVSVTYKQKKIERLGLSNDYGYINKPCWPAFFFTGDQTEVHRLLSNQHLINNKLYDERLYWPPSELIHAGVYTTIWVQWFIIFYLTNTDLTTYFYLSNTWTMKELSTLQYFYWNSLMSHLFFAWNPSFDCILDCASWS